VIVEGVGDRRIGTAESRRQQHEIEALEGPDFLQADQVGPPLRDGRGQAFHTTREVVGGDLLQHRHQGGVESRLVRRRQERRQVCAQILVLSHDGNVRIRPGRWCGEQEQQGRDRQ
jgi:hypothetical protein